MTQKDKLFNCAAKIVVEHQNASHSILQRKLAIGYNQASQIINQLEANKIIGKFNGAKAREILIANVNDLKIYLDKIQD